MSSDSDAIVAFLEGGEGSGPAVSVIGDALLVEDWWYVALRLSAEAVIVTAEEPPTRPDLIEMLQEEMSARGLARLDGDFPLIEPLAFTEMSTAGALWELWAVHRATGEAALVQRVGTETPPPI